MVECDDNVVEAYRHRRHLKLIDSRARQALKLVRQIVREQSRRASLKRR
jgi:hypothetical protein